MADSPPDGPGKPKFTPLILSDEEWRKRLTPEQFRVARGAGTECAFTPGNLSNEKRKGVYRCVGCASALWSSANKYDSGSGWPSFWKPLDSDLIGTKVDHELRYPRTEVHCAVCGAHMGHVFQDGPAPTGQRWCINGAVLKFEPEGDK